MAEYDNIQLYSNYQSHNITNDNNNSTVKCLKSRVAWNNKRKKLNHCDENMTTRKCQRPNNNYRSSPATSLITLPYRNDADSSETSLITSRQDNNSNKSVIIKNNRRYCIDDIDNNEELHRDNTVYRKLPIRKYFSCYNKSNTFTLALLLVIGLLFKINLCCGFILDGTQNSYAQFRKWYTGLNGTLELEFKTEQPNGLVLYTDDGGTYDFFELKLVEGALRLRYNLGGGAQIITVGRDLHDGHWHKVQVLRNDEHTTLTVDGVSQSKASRGKEFQFGKFATNSEIFVGGMPHWYNAKLALLALPSVIFEPRFRGSVRNLVYMDQPGVLPRRQEMRQPRDVKCGDSPCEHADLPKEKVTRGLRNNVTDACERHDPCQHGGICISTDSGPLCECRNLEYEGTYCERDKAPSEATFRGTEFLSYDLGQTGGEPIVSAQDAISLYFRTRQPNGLLFFTGHGTDYLNLAIRDGGVSLTMGLANGKQEMHIKPARVRFDDHQWHRVTVHRRIQEISSITSFCRLVVVVDEVYTDHSHIAGKFTILSSSKVYVGGSVNPRALLGARVHNNFVGCLRKVEFSADTLRLNLIDLARTGSKLISVVGRVEYNCPSGDPQDPVTFTTRDSHLVLPPWEVSKQGVISFKFRTNEPNGLIILSTGTRPPRSDLFAVELLNGHIYIHMDLGSGATKVRASRRRVDDGIWHELTVRRSGRDGKVGVDGQYNEFKTPGDSTQLELDSPLYIGGIGPPYASVNIPPALWTGTLRQGYVGCLRDLVLSGKPVDIAAYARQQDSAAVKPSCHIQTVQCVPNPCQNGGVCSEGWNRPLCDCSGTLYTGPTCGRESATLAFNGSQHLTIWTGGNQGMRTQTEELVLRFKTSRPTGLLLLTSADTNSPDRLEIALVAGRVRANVRLGDREKNLLGGQGVLNDNNWHTVRFSRRASNLRLQVDGAAPVRGMLSETILGRHSTLEVRSLHLGGLFHAEEEIQMQATMANFVGQLQGFVFNGHRFIDVVKSLGPELTAIPQTTFKLTARFINSPPGNPYQVATFKSKHSYVGLAMLKAFESVYIDFRFKTLEANGIILFNGGKKTDFICVELANGHIHYIFDMGDGPVTIRDKSKVHLNDNRWHSVSIRRPGPKIHSLVVDDSLETYVTTGNSMHLKLDGILYIGGVFKDMYGGLSQAAIVSRVGFDGCLASVDLADISPNLVDDAVVPSSLVVPGCEGPTKCSENACANRGTCVQQWNAYACECDMTSYTGPTCYDESVAYEFGAGRGLIQYQFPTGNQPDTEEDNISLGFITSKADAVLLRIESSNTQDYFELEIVEGNIFAVFNVGTHDLPLGEIGVKVSDNTYHVVRFTRSGGNATLQIDDYNVQALHAQGHLSTVFNSMGNVQVGGKVPKGAGRSRIERPFAGVIAGLSINRLRALDLAAERDPQITMRGDVQLVTGVLDRNDLQSRMQQTPASGYPGVMDDLIFSGAGSGCRGDDEDECMPPFENGSGDDLITPVYVPPTKQTSTAAKPKSKENEKLCDDEDCLHGSGSGEVTDSFTSTSVSSKTDPKETSPEFTSFTTTEDRRTDTTIPDTTNKEDNEAIISSSGTTALQETTHLQTFGTITTVAVVPSSSSTSTTVGTSSSSTSTTGTSTTTTTKGTTPYIPPQTETTVPYTIKETVPPEPSTPEHEVEHEIYQPEPPHEDYEEGPNHFPDPPMPEPETERPPLYKTPPPFMTNPGIYSNTPTRPPPKNKHGRINTEAEERTAMIIGIVAGALIAVILVILLVLWIKSNGDRSYKMEHDLKYGHGANAALLGHNAGHSNNQQHGAAHHGAGANQGGGLHGNNNGQQQQHHQQYGNGSYNGGAQNYDAQGNGNGAGHHSSNMGLNGSLRQQQGSQHGDRNGMSAGLVQPKAKRNSKDIKEWYV